MKNLLKNKFFISGVIVFFVGVFVLILLNVFLFLQYYFVDILQSNNSFDVKNKIVVVEIDDRTLEVLGYPDAKVFSEFLNFISQYSPKVVGFDVFFSSEFLKNNLFLLDVFKVVDNVVLIEKSKFIEKRGVINFVKLLDKFDDLFIPSNVSFAINVGNVVGNDKVRFMIPFAYDEDEVIYSFVGKIVNGVFGGDNFYMKNGDIYVNDLKIPLYKGDLIINYGGDSDIIKVSFVDVLNGNGGYDLNKLFQNSVVLIGYTSRKVFDNYNTPVKSLMSGVEIHANALQTVLDGRFLRYLWWWEEVLLILIFSVFSVFVFMFSKVRWSVLFFVGVAVGYWFLVAPFLFGVGVIVDLVGPYFVLIFSFLLVYLYRY